MLSHHAEVFKQLQAQFPDAEVFVGTSDKVEPPKSPFNFKEKQLIAAAHGVPSNRVLAVTRPYHQEDYAKYFNPAETVIIFAVGEKDLDRFPFNNVDPKTGLDMTVKGESKPKYYQKINTISANPKSMSERGYITLAPTIKIGDEVASASAFRDALKSAPDIEAAKQIYTKQFGTYNEKVFNLIYNKIASANMSEQINILRKLAGLPMQEAAPVEFSGAEAKTAKFLPPNDSSAKMSIANRFPKGADVNDPTVKQEQFIQALLRSPEALMSEFSERLDPKDDNSLAVGQKLSDIMQIMNQKDIGIASLPKDLKQFVLDLTVNAVKNMALKAGDDSPAYKDMDIDDEEDEFKRESVDLASIRNDYGIEESKPDFLDLDKDGDEEESMKKAAKDKVKEGDDEDEDDDSWIPSEDEFEKEIEHGYKGRTTEGFSSEADQILAKCGSGELDCYDVMTNPKTPAEATAAKIIQQMYDDVAIDHHLHPDDDFEKILDIVADQLDNDYGNSDADTREAVEVDELSKNTLGSYVKKAADSTRVNTRWAARTGDRDAEDIVDKRRKGINKAVDKLTNEDVEGTAGNAMEAALAELRKLAGLR
jgi:hypothetical protein